MRLRPRTLRRLIPLAALSACLIAPAAASATFHLTKVSEVYTGGANPAAAYVELQAYETGENLLGGHSITVYDAAGTAVHTFPLDHNIASTQRQRTRLVAADASAQPNGVTPDYVDPALGTSLNKNGGAVCFEAIDCVAWGNFAGTLPSPVGTPAAPTGLPNGASITRDISAGCATLLEAGDDTNDSAADFDLTTDRTPRSSSEKPTEKACGGSGGAGPQTSIDKGPKKKTAKKSAKFRFSSPDEDATFECSLDGKRFKSCDSPLKLKRVKPGKHVFSVRAVVAGTADKSPADYRWKRIVK